MTTATGNREVIRRIYQVYGYVTQCTVFFGNLHRRVYKRFKHEDIAATELVRHTKPKIKKTPFKRVSL